MRHPFCIKCLVTEQKEIQPEIPERGIVWCQRFVAKTVRVPATVGQPDVEAGVGEPEAETFVSEVVHPVRGAGQQTVLHQDHGPRTIACSVDVLLCFICHLAGYYV